MCVMWNVERQISTLTLSVLKIIKNLKPWDRANRHKHYDLRTFPLIFFTYRLNLEIRKAETPPAEHCLVFPAVI